VPDGIESFDDAERVRGYASAFTADAVQLAYQICAQGRADLPLAPDEATGFTMTLLRLLAFEPAAAQGGARPATGGTPRREHADVPARSAPPQAPVANVTELRAPAARELPPRSAEPPPPPQAAGAAAAFALPDDPAQWPATVAALKLTGMAAQLAAQTEWVSLRGNVLTLALPVSHKHLADKTYADKLKAALEGATGRKLLLAFEVGDATSGSLAARERKAREEAHAQGEQAFREEPFVRDLVARFDATVKSDTITPLRGDPPAS